MSTVAWTVERATIIPTRQWMTALVTIRNPATIAKATASWTLTVMASAMRLKSEAAWIWQPTITIQTPRTTTAPANTGRAFRAVPIPRPSTTIRRQPKTTGRAIIRWMTTSAVPIRVRAITTHSRKKTTAHVISQVPSSIAMASASILTATGYAMWMNCRAVPMRPQPTTTRTPRTTMVRVNTRKSLKAAQTSWPVTTILTQRCMTEAATILGMSLVVRTHSQ